MSTALKVTYPEKTNNPTDSDSIRKFFATEANEIKTVTDDHADQIEDLKSKLVESSNPYYGRYTSLAFLQAAHPTAELNAWAVIDAGTGITPQIASWDNTNTIWEIAGYTSNNVDVANYASLPTPGTEGITYLTKNTGYLYRWYNSKYNLVGGSAPVEVRIQGALVETYGKTDLTTFEDNDKFRIWVNNTHYYQGIIKDATDFVIPTDLTNTNKVSLTLRAIK